VSERLNTEPPAVRPVLLIHQEGVIALVAVIGLGIRDGSPLDGLAAAGPIAWSVGIGVVAGVGASAALWLTRRLPPLAELQRFQSRLVRGWSAADAAAVALLSGIAEEALLRALLQPVIGLVPAALLFAVLHLVPDRRLWMWPVIALVLGLALGVLFEHYGYPASAAAHVAINLLALMRLRRGREEDAGAAE
jgi:membrane protease YdiL (CAAX protease family)